MNVGGTVYYKEEFKKLTEFDQICPKCRTSQYTYATGSKTLEIKGAVANSNHFTHATQYDYMCSVCGSPWKGLPYSGENKKSPEQYRFFMRLADLRLCDLDPYEVFLRVWSIAWFIATILMLLLSVVG